MLKYLFNKLDQHQVVITPTKRLAQYLQQQYAKYQQQAGVMAWENARIFSFSGWILHLWQQRNTGLILLNEYQYHLVWQQIIAKDSSTDFLLPSQKLAKLSINAWEMLQQYQVPISTLANDVNPDVNLFYHWAKKFQQYCEQNACIDINSAANFLKNNEEIILFGFDAITPQLKAMCPNFSRFNLTIPAKTQQRLSLVNTEAEIYAMARWAKMQLEMDADTSIGCIVPNLTMIRNQVERIFEKVFQYQDKFNISAGLTLSSYPLIKQALAIINNVEATDKQRPSNWQRIFVEQLNTNNWLGYFEVSEQLMQRFKKLLGDFATLDLVVTNISLSAATQFLITMCECTIFQAATTTNTPIQILGILEASGLRFDQLWVMGLSDNLWPPAPNPNPFIPLKLQQQLQMPHSSYAREISYARAITQRLSQSAKQNVIYSYPEQIDDQMVNPSPLLTDIPVSKEIELADFISDEELIYQTKAIEAIKDQGSPIADDKKVSGGSTIFKLQSACPFRAFAQCRLGAKTIEQEELGLNAKEKGILVHAILEQIWQQIGSSTKLNSYSEAKLTEIITTAIQTVIKTTAKINTNSRFAKIEQQRLLTLLWNWLQLEKNRTPFTVISQEAWTNVTIANIKTCMRIDRIDKLAQGGFLIIDYKTGLTSTNAWADERPDDPQLPLYAITSKHPVIGISFAQINSKTIALKGIAKISDIAKGIKKHDDWHNLISAWQENISKLADEFLQGIAEAKPKYGDKTCLYCDLSTLCRINEENL